MTLGWNVVGVIILAFAAIEARSVDLAGFGLDSVIEIGASTVVLWELADVAQSRQRAATRMIGSSFVALSIYLAVQSTIALAVGFRPHHSPVGITWTAVTALAMFVLATGKAQVGTALGNPVLKAEGRVTMIGDPSKWHENVVERDPSSTCRSRFRRTRRVGRFKEPCSLGSRQFLPRHSSESTAPT